MIYSIEEVVFQRKKGSNQEIGLLFNEGEFKILDLKGELVNNVWNYQKQGFAISDLCIGKTFEDKIETIILAEISTSQYVDVIKDKVLSVLSRIEAMHGDIEAMA